MPDANILQYWKQVLAPLVVWIVFLIPILTALVIAFYNALYASKYRFLKFLVYFFEILGWFVVFSSIAITVLGYFFTEELHITQSDLFLLVAIGIPSGMGVLMICHIIFVMIEIADNTRETNHLLKKRMGT